MYSALTDKSGNEIVNEIHELTNNYEWTSDFEYASLWLHFKFWFLIRYGNRINLCRFFMMISFYDEIVSNYIKLESMSESSGFI